MIHSRKLEKKDSKHFEQLISEDLLNYQEYIDQGWSLKQINNQLDKNTNLSYGFFYNDLMVSFIFGDLINIEKNLLAAISFQESQWDPRAKSNMGVRGMMMVTLETAALVGVEKRLNPEQNIKGGAKYFSMLQNKNKIGPSKADKLSIVLASYNLGPTNIIKIASQIDSNIENVTWEDIKEKLKVTSGEDLNMMDNGSYSRAQQAIDYVDRVKSYYQLMSAHACVNPKDQLTFF